MTATAGEEQSEEQLLRGYTARLFLGISVGWAAVAFGREILPPLLPAIMGDLQITPFQAGAALTALWLMRALNQYPAGRFADRLSRKTVLVGSLLFLIGGFVLLSGAVVYSLFFLGAVLLGAGAGGYSISVRAATADLYVEKRGQAFGIQNGLTSLASVGAAGGAVLILAVATWRSAFLPLAVFLAAVTVALHRWHREPYVVERVDLEIVETARRIFAVSATRRITAAFSFFIFALLGLMSFLPTFLQIEKEFSPALASAGFALVYIIGAFAAPMAGRVGDRVGKIRTVIGLLLFGIVGLLALLVVDSLLLIAVSIVVLAVGFRAFIPVTQAFLMDTFSDDTMGGDLGGVKTIYGIIGSLGPSYVGWVADWSNYTVAYFGLILCLVGSLFFIVLVWYTE